jgi:hypothetical protein
MMGEIKKGDQIEAKVNDPNHALSIRKAQYNLRAFCTEPVLKNAGYDRGTMLRRRFHWPSPFSLRSVWHALCLKLRVHAWRHADRS